MHSTIGSSSPINTLGTLSDNFAANYPTDLTRPVNIVSLIFEKVHRHSRFMLGGVAHNWQQKLPMMYTNLPHCPIDPKGVLQLRKLAHPSDLYWLEKDTTAPGGMVRR